MTSYTNHYRNRLVQHLQQHADHRSRYKKNPSNFGAMTSWAIELEHWRLHDCPWPHHARNDLRTGKEEEDMKELELKVTVAGYDPDAVLAAILRNKAQAGAALMSHLGTNALDVTRIERADGQPAGLEAEFEEYWKGYASMHGGASYNEKASARDVFLYAAKKYAREGPGNN